MVVHTNPLSFSITRIQSKLGQKFRFAEPPMIISLVSHQCRFPGDWPKSLDQMNLTAEAIHSHPWLVSSPTRPEGSVIDHRRNHSRSNSANKLHSWVRSVRNIWSKTLDHFCGRVVSKPNLPWEWDCLTTFLDCRAKQWRMSHNDVKADSMNRKAGFPGRSWFSMIDDWWTTKPSLFPIHYVQTTTHTYLIFVSGTTGGARGEKICHVEKFLHMTYCYLKRFSTWQIDTLTKFSTWEMWIQSVNWTNDVYNL